MTRVGSTPCVFSARPFEGGGTSLYVNTGDAVQYRRLRVAGGGTLLQGASFPLGTGIPKTARVAVASDPADSINWTIPPGLYGEAVQVDLRTFRDDVESDADGYGETVVLDGGGDPILTINATAALLNATLRTGGIVQFRFAYYPAATGVQSDTLSLVRTAGPSSPADVVVSAPTVLGTPEVVYVTITTSPLLDTAPYTFKLVASAGAVTADLLTGLTVTVDASGPPAPTVTTGDW